MSKDMLDASFEGALYDANLCTLPDMQEAWRQLGSPSLDGWTGTDGATAIDLLYLGFQSVATELGTGQTYFPLLVHHVDDTGGRNCVVKVENIGEIIAWLQGLGSRFTIEAGLHYGALEDLCAAGLDLTGIDLLQLSQDWGPGHLELSLTATIFSSQYWGDPSALYTFLEAGADMYPLDQPGASARSPPPLAKPPDDAVQQILRIFWPDTYPRKPDDQFVPVEEINAQEICDFFAAKREKQRREEAWERRGLTLLCSLRCVPKAAKVAKVAKTPGQLVRDVFSLEPLLGRHIITFL
jgi:hypothetical protein